METIILIAVLILNVLISVWNTYAAGISWKDTMTLGNRFDKAVLYSAVIQAGIGFSMPIILMLTYLATTFLTMGDKPNLTPEEAKQLVEWISSLWYVAIIFPILGSGFAIWLHSIRIAFQRRDFASIATAGWNTFAQIHNTLSAIDNLGGAFDKIGDLFSSLTSSKGNNKNNAAILAILIVVISIVGGFMLAIYLTKKFAKNANSRIEEYAKQM